MTLKLPEINIGIGVSAAAPLPSVDHDVAIIGYYSGDGSDDTAATPVKGSVSAALHSLTAVQDFIGDTSPVYWAAAGLLNHVQPTSIHVLSLGPPGTPVTVAELPGLLTNLQNTDGAHLPDIYLAPGLALTNAGGVPANGITSANVLSEATLPGSNRDGYYAALDAYAASVNRIAYLEVPHYSYDNAVQFASVNKSMHTLLLGNRMKFAGGGTDFRSPVGNLVGGILRRELDPEYGRAAGVDYAPLVGVSELEWNLHHDLTDHTPTNDATRRLVNDDITIATRTGAAFDMIGGTIGGYPTGDFRAYLGVLRSLQHLQYLMRETTVKFGGRIDDGPTLALAQADFREAYSPLVPSEFASITLTPTNFLSDGQLEFDGDVEVYLPVKRTTVTLHLSRATFDTIGAV